ncbi:uncharacterized protein LOC136714430 [Amia ocellicauda]|uniref:uncharacterized protein LOC136714430 n=1 Tax=Amia ocellicauda TaxID=2972642 RepID=UPI0034638F31
MRFALCVVLLCLGGRSFAQDDQAPEDVAEKEEDQDKADGGEVTEAGAGDGVDPTALSKIVAQLRSKLPKTAKSKNIAKPKDQLFAIAVVVSVGVCKGSEELQNQTPLMTALSAMTQVLKKKSLYESKELVAAVPERIKYFKKTLESPEHQLLHSRVLEKLMMAQADKSQCLVFLTLSPFCDKDCLENSNQSLLSDLDVFQQWTGPKAFVFNKLYSGNSLKIFRKKDNEKIAKKRRKAFLHFEHKVELFRCQTDVCHQCGAGAIQEVCVY